MSKIRLGVVEDFPPGTMKTMTVQGKEYLVSNIEGVIYVNRRVVPSCQGQDRRRDAGRERGRLSKHGAEFDVRTGKNLKNRTFRSPKASDLRSYKVTVEGKDVFVDIQ